MYKNIYAHLSTLSDNALIEALCAMEAIKKDPKFINQEMRSLVIEDLLRSKMLADGPIYTLPTKELNATLDKVWKRVEKAKTCSVTQVWKVVEKDFTGLRRSTRAKIRHFIVKMVWNMSWSRDLAKLGGWVSMFDSRPEKQVRREEERMVGMLDYEFDSVTKQVMISKRGKPPVWAKKVEFTDKQIVRLHTGKEIRTIDYNKLNRADQETIRQLLMEELHWSGEGSFVWDGKEIAARRKEAAVETVERKLKMPVKDLTLIFYRFKDADGNWQRGNGKKFGDLIKMIDTLRDEKESTVYWKGMPPTAVEEVEKVLIQK